MLNVLEKTLYDVDAPPVVDVSNLPLSAPIKAESNKVYGCATLLRPNASVVDMLVAPGYVATRINGSPALL
jgi:hypothetical protein